MATKKKTAKKKRAKYLSKIDPLLMMAVSRTKVEKKPAIEKLKTIRSAQNIPGTMFASIKEVPLGMQSLTSQISPRAVEHLVEEDLVQVLVDTEKIQDVERRIKSWKGNSKKLSSTTLLVNSPRSRLNDLAKLTSVKYIEASTKLKPLNDLAHVSAGLIVGTSRTVSQTGLGVLVGIVDTGIDVTHSSFIKGDKTRIVNYLDQELQVEYTQANIDAGQCTESPDFEGHGTHVAGIAAGNGLGSPERKHQGVATEADLAIVKTTFDSGNIADGVAHIFEVAESRNQPCVVNLSLGGHYGGHDGSSLIERAIDQLSGPGRIVVTSAGNEGGSQIHASTVLGNGVQHSRWVADLELDTQLINNQQLGSLIVQVWHQFEDNITITLRSPMGDLIVPQMDDEIEVDRGTYFVEASLRRANYSGDHQTTFRIITIADIQVRTGWSIIAEARAEDINVGAVHAWIINTDMGRFTSGIVQSHLVGMPGTAFSAITVASYATRNKWKSRDPQVPNVVLGAVNLEDISHFSSPGPTRDNHNKPEIAAPGQMLISALSKDTPQSVLPPWLRIPRIPYVALQGTSMAAPYVTGALALLLEKDPTINWAEAKRRLIKSAHQDNFTTPCWNERWGYGKLNIERLLDIEPNP